MSKLLLFSIFIVSSANLLSDKVTDTVIEYSAVSALDHSYQDLGTGNYTLEIMTDSFPEETSWFLVDVTAQDTIATSGGDLESFGTFTIITQELCLDLTHCYEFTILDSYGDGLTVEAGVATGYYSIKDQNGTILIGNMQNNFEYEESNYFCPGDDCQLNYEITVEQPVSGQNTFSILIDITGGVGPEFLYSINGGIAVSDPLFVNIGPGEYLVEVFDVSGCKKKELITLGNTSTEDPLGIQEDIILYPNPSDGLIRLETTSLLTDEIFIDVDIYDTSGKLIHKSSIAKTGNIHKGTISLIPFASGQYYIHLNYKSGSILKATVKK